MKGSNPERVVTVLLEAGGRPLCDDCVALLAKITNRIAVNPITSALGLTSDFMREKHLCSRCRERKLVTQAAR